MTFLPHGYTGPGVLPDDLEWMIQEELSAGEKLAWVGRPHPSRLVAGALPRFFLGLCFAGFTIFWFGVAFGGAGGGRPMRRGGGPPFFLILFGLPFLMAGLGMLAGPFVVARNARKTCYALTDRRAIVWEGALGSGVRVRSYRPDELRAMARHQRTDGSGDLVFEEVHTQGARGRPQVLRRGFIAIDDIRDVEALVRSTLLDD